MKNILYFGILFVLISCAGSKIKREDSYYLTNKTGKKIIHQIVYNKMYTAGIDTLSFYSDRKSDEAEFEWMVTSTFASARNKVVSVDDTNIYNITDTTSLGWSPLWGDKGVYARFGESKNETSFKDGEYLTYKIDYYLTIDDELLLLMKKDYTMLDKFREYYK